MLQNLVLLASCRKGRLDLERKLQLFSEVKRAMGVFLLENVDRYSLEADTWE
jgi:hypothetical protein